MAALHFDLVSPERVLFSGDVDQVDLPGAEGDMGILAGHAPLVTALRPGILTIFRGGAREPIVIGGADHAVALESFDGMTLAADIKDAEEDMADATDQEQRDKLARRLDQLKALQAALAARTSTAH